MRREHLRTLVGSLREWVLQKTRDEEYFQSNPPNYRLQARISPVRRLWLTVK